MILEKIKAEVGKAVVGMDEIIELMTISLIAEGHILLEGIPGIAKTTLSKNFASTLGLKFVRIQMTPDILPADILGHTFYDMRTGDFKMRKGPIFANVVLVDEINRASPKTQSALLEAMEERQVTIEGVTLRLPEPFIVIATRNPIELEGVYNLPAAQVDRFMMKIDLTYLDEKQEKLMLKRKSLGKFSAARQVVPSSEILHAKKDFRKVHVSDAIVDYIYSIVKETRLDERVILGASPRAGEHLLYAARVHAYLSGRNYVIPDDVKKLALPVLAHRIIVKPEYEIDNITGKEIVMDALDRVEVPTE